LGCFHAPAMARPRPQARQRPAGLCRHERGLIRSQATSSNPRTKHPDHLGKPRTLRCASLGGAARHLPRAAPRMAVSDRLARPLPVKLARAAPASGQRGGPRWGLGFCWWPYPLAAKAAASWRVRALRLAVVGGKRLARFFVPDSHTADCRNSGLLGEERSGGER
jgi:hypothetical protein